MSDTQAETEALLPWTEQHLKSALINLIEAAKNSVRGPERGGSENAVSGIYQQIVAAWNTRAQPKPVAPSEKEACAMLYEYDRLMERGHSATSTMSAKVHFGSADMIRAKIIDYLTAQPKPEVAPDDEALIDDFRVAAIVYGALDENPGNAAAGKVVDQKHQALRRRIAELRATSLKYQLAFGDRDNDAHRLADRVAELEAAQAACRDKTIEECAAIVDAAGLWKLTGKDRDRAIASAIRTLKTKEPTNG